MIAARPDIKAVFTITTSYQKKYTCEEKNVIVVIIIIKKRKK